MAGRTPLLAPASARRPRTEHTATAKPEPAWRQRPASERAIGYLESLRRKHEADRLGPLPADATAGQVSDAIEWCKRQPLRPPAPKPEPVPNGIYLWNGTDPRQGGTDPIGHWIVRVRTSIYTEAAGRQYAQVLPASVLDASPVGEGEVKPDKPEWERAPGLLRKLGDRPLMPLPESYAGQFGALYGVCIFCGRLLSNDKTGASIERGYGPRCAAKAGLPWG